VRLHLSDAAEAAMGGFGGGGRFIGGSYRDS